LEGYNKRIKMKDLKNLKDEQIVELVRTKDKELYLEVVMRYQEKLLRYAFNLIQDKLKAEDAVQESFIKAFINLNSFNLKMKFSSWIYRIVHNQVINIFNKNKRELPLLDNVDYDSGKNLEFDLTKKEIQIRVNKCISKMSLIYSEPLSLYFIEEKSYEEISDILRLPVGTVGTRINRAKAMMKKICQNIK
jgi:RNA polymerase sigma-70 factor, ECF subfamily